MPVIIVAFRLAYEIFAKFDSRTFHYLVVIGKKYSECVGRVSNLIKKKLVIICV